MDTLLKCYLIFSAILIFSEKCIGQDIAEAGLKINVEDCNSKLRERKHFLVASKGGRFTYLPQKWNELDSLMFRDETHFPLEIYKDGKLRVSGDKCYHLCGPVSFFRQNKVYVFNFSSTFLGDDQEVSSFACYKNQRLVYSEMITLLFDKNNEVSDVVFTSGKHEKKSKTSISVKQASRKSEKWKRKARRMMV